MPFAQREVHAGSVGVSADIVPAPPSRKPPVDQELRAWKESRSFNVPWKQLYLMASICFGLGSFVLPSTVNGAVDWLLYALAAMSFYAWLRGRRSVAKS